jgi:hypothetical protein
LGAADTHAHHLSCLLCLMGSLNSVNQLRTAWMGAVNFTTPADLVAAQAAAAATPPVGQSDADKALTNSVAAAVDLTKALTDSMSKTLQALGYSPSTAPGRGASFPKLAVLALLFPEDCQGVVGRQKHAL